MSSILKLRPEKIEAHRPYSRKKKKCFRTGLNSQTRAVKSQTLSFVLKETHYCLWMTSIHASPPLDLASHNIHWIDPISPPATSKMVSTKQLIHISDGSICQRP